MKCSTWCCLPVYKTWWL